MAEASVPHIADSHEVIRVIGARENNLKNVDVEIPKRRLTVFTGVSGSGKSSSAWAVNAARTVATAQSFDVTDREGKYMAGKLEWDNRRVIPTASSVEFPMPSRASG